MTLPQLILIAGPYRSGANGDPAIMARNLRRLEEASWPIFAAGHLPVIGEWIALPIIDAMPDPAGTTGDVMYETASRLLTRCDAVLRLEGESAGADQDVAIARKLGLPVYFDVAEIRSLDGRMS